MQNIDMQLNPQELLFLLLGSSVVVGTYLLFQSNERLTSCFGDRPLPDTEFEIEEVLFSICYMYVCIMFYMPLLHYF